MANRSGFSALIQGRCPRCREGKMYVHPFYKIPGFQQMHETCSCCGLKFEVEPGFFWGAMFITYAINVALVVNVMLIYFNFFYEASEWWPIGITAALSIVFAPLNLRASRVLMMYLFSGVKYRGKTP